MSLKTKAKLTARKMIQKAEEDLENWIEQAMEGPPPEPTGRLTNDQNDPRSLTPEDISAFEQAAEGRPDKITPAQTDEFLERLRVLDVFRYRRLRKDLKWVRKHAADYGLPEPTIPWDKIR